MRHKYYLITRSRRDRIVHHSLSGAYHFFSIPKESLVYTASTAGDVLRDRNTRISTFYPN